MKQLVAALTLIVFSAAISSTARACGEGLFSMGEGVRYHGYLAPRPATILVYDEDTHGERQSTVYRGLVQAGHRLAVAHDPAQLAQVLREHAFDVVIADQDAVATVSDVTASAAPTVRLLPVVARGRGERSAVGDQFEFLLPRGAGLSQYLRQINRLMRD